MIPVILDVDTGIDDALAILFALAHPELDVRAITCVDGNTSLDQVVANTLAVLDAAGAGDIPVAAGAREPLIEPSREAAWVHGADGLAETRLPPSARVPVEVHAVELLRRTLADAPEPITLITLAPMTNIALLIRMHPEVVPRIARIVFMGGSASRGNATAVAEFNVWHDPEAAFIVLNSGVPLTMYGLDVFERVVVDPDRIARLRTSDHPAEQLAGRLLGYTAVHPASGETFTYAMIGDAGAVAAVAAPELLRFENLPAQVELAGGYSRGHLIVDRREPGEGDYLAARPWPRADVALEVDAEAMAALFLDTLRRA